MEGEGENVQERKRRKMRRREKITTQINSSCISSFTFPSSSFTPKSYSFPASYFFSSSFRYSSSSSYFFDHLYLFPTTSFLFIRLLMHPHPSYIKKPTICACKSRVRGGSKLHFCPLYFWISRGEGTSSPQLPHTFRRHAKNFLPHYRRPVSYRKKGRSQGTILQAVCDAKLPARKAAMLWGIRAEPRPALSVKTWLHQPSGNEKVAVFGKLFAQ